MSFDLYPEIIRTGHLPPGTGLDDVDALCEEIEAACKGFGTDEG